MRKLLLTINLIGKTSSLPNKILRTLQAHLANPTLQTHKPKLAKRACNLAKSENKKSLPSHDKRVAAKAAGGNDFTTKCKSNGADKVTGRFFYIAVSLPRWTITVLLKPHLLCTEPLCPLPLYQPQVLAVWNLFPAI